MIQNATLLIIILLLVDSLHFVFARLLLPHIAPATSVLFVLGIATSEMLIYGLATKQLNFRLTKQEIAFFSVIGLLIAVSTNINYEAVAFIDPGTASLLAQTSVVFGLGFGIFWLKDRLSPQQLVGAGIAIFGVFVIEYQGGDYLRIGSLMVIGSSFLYSLHAAITKRFGQNMDFVSFFFYRLAFTTAFLVVYALGRGLLVWPSQTAWPLLILVGTTDVVFSRALYYLALRRLTMSMHTLIFTLSPVVAILWAWGLFGTLPGLQQLMGGAAVLAGITLISLAQHRSNQKAKA
jgi:drug/metabolite transporter (DMT)-like permease